MLFCLTIFAYPFLFAAPGLAVQASSVKAFYLTDFPSDYGSIEKLFASLKDAGADTVITGPLARSGPLTRNSLPHIIFLAHQARLRLFVIVPTRADEEALASYPEWEDRRYDLRSGTLQPDGKLDLSHPDALNYLVQACKNIAAFSIDGIVLGDDFSYADTEGMSRRIFDAYKQRFKAELVPGRAFAKVERIDASYRVSEYGEGYQNFVRMKQEVLVDAVKAVIAACRRVNQDVKFAAPLRFTGFENQLSALPEYVQDINGFKSTDLDYYWLALPHRENLGLSYKKGMEAIARTAKIISTAVKEPCKTILILPLVNPKGRLLPSTEIEEATEMAKQGGEPCIAYRVRKDTALPVPLMRKLFKEQQAQ
jgi:hypothetical protein